jgi:citrate/tricarballylate utilization protein
MHDTDAVRDARRAMEICNACRYCEGMCAVFPAMELRREFSNADLSYLANLCHNCRGCYYACQYAPPHEFGVNIPRTFAEVRMQSYEAYAWPPALAAAFHRNGVLLSLLMALCLAGVLIATMALQSADVIFAAHPAAPGAFYAVIPYPVMVAAAGVTFVFSVAALVMGAVRFWRGAGAERPAGGASIGRALSDILTLRYLDGGGQGCNDRDESFSSARRWFHHLMFYGFALCFASTSVATLYHHVLGEIAPYDLLSAPVILGTVGGIGMTMGATGLLWLRLTGDAAPAAPKLLGPDVALLLLLGLTALSGLVLLAVRTTPAMGTTLAVHLGLVLALFIVLPYSRMVHGVYRAAALLRYAIERDRPTGHS